MSDELKEVKYIQKFTIKIRCVSNQTQIKNQSKRLQSSSLVKIEYG